MGLGVAQIFGTTGFGKCLLTLAKIENEKDVHFVTDSVCTKFDKVCQKTFYVIEKSSKDQRENDVDFRVCPFQ